MTKRNVLILIFSLIGGIFIMLIILSLLVMIPLSHVREQANQTKCKSNLDQIGRCMALYRYDYGRGLRWPDADGSAFVARLYQTRLLMEERVYLCPSTNDTYLDKQGKPVDLGKIVSPDKENHISYAGRKNATIKEYPGIYRPLNLAITTIASDDWSGRYIPGTENHNSGQYINFLFLDGHVEGIRDHTVESDVDGYTKYATEHDKLADPLAD